MDCAHLRPARGRLPSAPRLCLVRWMIYGPRRMLHLLLLILRRLWLFYYLLWLRWIVTCLSQGWSSWIGLMRSSMFDSKMTGFELVVRRIGDVECLASGVNCRDWCLEDCASYWAYCVFEGLRYLLCSSACGDPASLGDLAVHFAMIENERRDNEFIIFGLRSENKNDIAFRVASSLGVSLAPIEVGTFRISGRISLLTSWILYFRCERIAIICLVHFVHLLLTFITLNHACLLLPSHFLFGFSCG